MEAQHSIWGSEEAATCGKLSAKKPKKRKLVKTFEKTLQLSFAFHYKFKMLKTNFYLKKNKMTALRKEKSISESINQSNRASPPKFVNQMLQL